MPRRKTIPDADVLRFADELLLEHGPYALTLQHISQRAGIAPSTLLQRFRSKDNLLTEVCRRHEQEIEARFQPKDLDSLGHISAALRGLLALHPGPAAAAQRLAWLLSLGQPALRQLEKCVQRSLWEAAKQGQLKGAKGSELAGEIVHLYLATLLASSMRGAMDPAEYMDARLQFLLDRYR